MPRSTRRRSRKHDREERDRSDSDEDPRPREQEDRKAPAVRSSKGAEGHEKRPPSAPAKLPNVGDASGSPVEGQKKRKSRGEKEDITGDDRWSEDERLSYYDSKKSRNSDGDVKGKSARKSKEYDRSNEVSRRKSDKETLLEEHSAGEHHRVKERGREPEAGKSKESKQVLLLKEDGMDQQYKTVKDRSKDREKGKEGRHDASSKAMPRNKEVQTRDLDSDKMKNNSNGRSDDADRHREDELHDGESEKNGRHRKTKDQSAAKDESQNVGKGRQTLPRDVRTKIDGCYEQQHADEKFKDDMPRGVEKRREEKYKDDRSKAQDGHKSNKYKDDRHKEEEMHRDERYKEERSRHEDRHRDVKYKGERSKEEDRYKDERYKDKSRDEEKPRNERSDNSSRDKHRDDIYRYHRNQDGGSWDMRSSKDNTRDRSLEKHCKEEYNHSKGRYSKSKLLDNEVDTSAADRRSSKYRDDSKGKKRSYEESVHNGDLEPRNGKEYHGDAKRRSDVGSFVSSEDHRREYEKVDSRRDFERKSPTRSSTYSVKEQSRHFPKQEESSPRENGAALGRHRRTSDIQSIEGLSKTDANSNESSLTSKDGRGLRSDGRPTHFNDRPPSASDCQVSSRSNPRHNHDAVDGSGKNGNTRHHELLLNRQAIEKNYRSESPGHLHLPRDRPEMDTQRSFDDDNRSQIRERRSSSRSRRSGTVDNARGHGNTWNNPSSWPSPVPNGFGPFQHGPPIPGFHPAIHQFPQSLFGMRPSMDTNHAGMHYPLHGHPESFAHSAQPFPWHNPAEDPYLSRLPGWNANRSVFEEYSHSYGRQELGRNNDPDFQQQSESEVPLSSHSSDKPSMMQLPAQNQSQSSEVQTVETNAEKTDAHAPKYRSEATPAPSIVKVDSRSCSNYFKRLDISTSLASPELYKKCSTMAGELELAGSCKSTMHRCLKNNKDEHGYQAQGFKYMINSIFSGKTTSVFENALALYSSSTVSRKSKSLASSSQPESEEMIKEASVDMVEERNVAVGEDQALPCTDMYGEVHNNDQPHHAVVSSMPDKAGLVKDCSDTGEDKLHSDVEDTSLSKNHAEGHACGTEELEVPNNGEGDLPPKVSQPCCSSAVSIPDVSKEQSSGVVSDATFASASQSCEDVMPGCRVNFNRIPCSPGST